MVRIVTTTSAVVYCLVCATPAYLHTINITHVKNARLPACNHSVWNDGVMVLFLETVIVSLGCLTTLQVLAVAFQQTYSGRMGAFWSAVRRRDFKALYWDSGTAAGDCVGEFVDPVWRWLFISACSLLVNLLTAAFFYPSGVIFWNEGQCMVFFSGASVMDWTRLLCWLGVLSC